MREGLLTRRQLDGPAWRQLWRDVYVYREVPDDLRTRVYALGLMVPKGSVVSGTTAAWLNGADIRTSNAPLEVTLPRDIPMRPRRGVSIRRAEILPEDVRWVERIPVTTPLRTAFDLARRSTVPETLTEPVVAADALAHRGFFTPEQLADYATQSRFKGWRGVRQVAKVARHVEPLSDSPQESRLRMRLVLAGLPRPIAQFPIASDQATYYADLAYPERSTAIDYDGECHADQREADAERHNRITDAGWTHFIVTKRMMRDPTLISRIKRNLR